MATFIVSYDTHFGRNYDALYEGMEENGGVRLLESVWGIELNNTTKEVRQWVQGLLDDDDSILVVQVKPKPWWSGHKLETAATDWLKAHVAA